MSFPFDGTLIETDALQHSSFDDIQTQLRCSRCTSGRTAAIMTFYVSPNSPETQEGMYLRIKFWRLYVEACGTHRARYPTVDDPAMCAQPSSYEQRRETRPLSESQVRSVR